MALGNLNTADFIKGEGVTQEGNIITITPSSGTNLTGFVGKAFAVWTGTGLSFYVYWPAYYIAGTLYASGSTTITLDAADVTNDRLDVIAVDSSGGIKITGTPSADPVKPTVDNLTQLEITTILVGANATTPDAVTDEDIYKENLEWTGTSDVAGASFIDASSPFAGSKAVSIGSFTAGKYVKFVSATAKDISDYGFLKFYVKLKATFSTTAGFIISFKNGATVVSSSFTVTNGIYEFDRTDTSGYQLIVIPLSEFTFTSAVFNTLYIELKGSNTSGFYFDNIQLQGGIAGNSDLQNTITTITTDSGSVVIDQPNDAINMVGAGGATVSASGKTITITAGGGTTSDVLIDCGSFTAPNENLLIDCGSF